MKLNCDLGEGFDQIDAAIMPYIDMANIACGGHAGDHDSMMRTVALSQKNNVMIGAHPSYPDRAHFGRRRIYIEREELADSLYEQVESLLHCADAIESKLEYIKPHGALYNDALKDPQILTVLLELSQRLNLPLVLPARPKSQLRLDYPDHKFILEAFADRAYQANGELVPRSLPYAVLNSMEQAVAQARSLSLQHGTSAHSGEWVELNADTMCLHSDTPLALDIAKAVRAYLTS